MSKVLYDTQIGLYTVSYKGASKAVDKNEDYFVLESPEIVVSYAAKLLETAEAHRRSLGDALGRSPAEANYSDASFTFTMSKEMYIHMFSHGIIIIGRSRGYVLYGKSQHDFNGIIRGYVENKALYIFI